MSRTIRTLTIGNRQHPAQFPIRDFAKATSPALVAGEALSISLPTGHYEIRADVAFTYKHGPAVVVSGFASVPHDANVWLGVSLGYASELVVTAADAGTLWVVPAEVY